MRIHRGSKFAQGRSRRDVPATLAPPGGPKSLTTQIKGVVGHVNKTPIPSYHVKKFMEVYKRGLGISNELLKKLVPSAYSEAQ